jgi:hypothetical protein
MAEPRNAIGWVTNAAGAQAALANLNSTTVATVKANGVTLNQLYIDGLLYQ